MPILARIPCLLPALTLILLILQTGCGSSDVEMEFCFQMDANTVGANHILRRLNERSIKEIAVVTEKFPQYMPMLSVAEETSRIVADFDKYIERTRSEIIKEAGGLAPDDKTDKTKASRLADYQNKKIATRYFLSGEQSKGRDLKNKIIDTRNQILGLIDTFCRTISADVAFIKPEEIGDLRKNISLNVDDALWKKNEEKSWEYFTFYQSPVAKTLAILSALQSDAIKSESIILNFLEGKMGNGIDWGWIHTEPVSSPEACYVMLGKKFRTDIFLASSGEIMGGDIAIKVNGARIPLKEGKGHYEVLTKSIGEKAYRVEIIVLNTFTGRSKTYSKTFKYQVGQCSE
jgi:hypothetical protein